MGEQPIINLKQRTLDAFGDISILYEDQIEIGHGGGLRTVYGYQAPDGPRTGVMLVFSQQGRAYVIDIDGKAEAEDELMALADVVAKNWVKRATSTRGEGRWMDGSVEGLPVKIPAEHRPHSMDNGWQRFAGGDQFTFLAMRSEPTAEQGLFNALQHWLGVAGGSVQEFVSSEIYAHQRNDRSWARADFEYALTEGDQIAGAIMVTRIGDRFLILWAEAPLAAFHDYDFGILQTVVDELSRARYQGSTLEAP
jgi:hypothetical protein